METVDTVSRILHMPQVFDQLIIECVIMVL